MVQIITKFLKVCCMCENKNFILTVCTVTCVNVVHMHVLVARVCPGNFENLLNFETLF